MKIFNRHILMNDDVDAASTSGGGDTLLTGDTDTVDNSNTDSQENNTDDNKTDEQDDTQTDDTKSDDEQDATQGAPEKYEDFKLPEDVKFEGETLTKAQEVFKELNLSQEQAQKLVDFQAEQAASQTEAGVEAFHNNLKEWENQSRTDKDFGGDKFDQNLGLAKKALDQFGNDDVSRLLNESGFGSHPEVLRLLVKVGATLKEDVPGGGGHGVNDAPEEAHQILYGNK